MRLWFDTNTLFRGVAEMIEMTALARSRGLSPSISAQVYLERRRQIQVDCLTKGQPFNRDVYDEGFPRLFDVVDMGLDRRTASDWADKLALRYPNKKAWRAATLATLGGETRAMFETLPGRVPMTTDWWIALQAEDDPSDRVVCHENGEEWRHLREQSRLFTWDEARHWLEGRPSLDR